MARSTARRRRQTGRSAATHLGIPHYVLRSPEFGALNGWEVKLLVEVAGQYNGYNNGDLSCTWSQLARRGWRSNGTVRKALDSLLVAEWLICTRHGGRNRCALYAVSWWSIDDCKGKGLEIGPEKSASNRWQKTKSLGAMRTNVGAM
ncbi:MAG: hypothetical protein JNM58_04470 [Xanthomonadaceae bacterium]|nr:hypothetical protein [Xanthomonadaceae bacterium]